MPRPATGNREKLVEAALDLIWKSSYGSVSVDDICQQADVKKGSFYYYFESKAELAIAAMDAYWETKKLTLDDVYSASRPPLERFEKLSAFIIEKLKENQKKYGCVVGCPFTALGTEMACQQEEIRAKTDELSRKYRAYMLSALRDADAEGCFREGTDLEAKADKLSTFIMGELTMARIQNDITNLERDLQDGIFKILNVQA